MPKKDYFITIDTETTQDNLVADFAAVITDKKGNIHAQCAVLVKSVFTNQELHPLFHLYGDSGDMWSKAALPKRYAAYEKMLDNGTRMLGTKAAINKWLYLAAGKYNPILTAYNLPFDVDKCRNTEIDLDIFKNRFCLWAAAQHKWGHTKAYKNFALAKHAFNAPTKHENMSFKTNAETMARFILDLPDLPDEPHTALEDIIEYELAILNRLVSTTKKQIYLNAPAYNWRKYQVKDHFIAK